MIGHPVVAEVSGPCLCARYHTRGLPQGRWQVATIVSGRPRGKLTSKTRRISVSLTRLARVFPATVNAVSCFRPRTFYWKMLSPLGAMGCAQSLKCHF